MPWVKLDDNLFANPKIVDAPPSARTLYVAGLCHCAGGLTDGAISKKAVPLLSAQAGAPRAAAKALVTARLWIDEGDIYRVPDYLEYNPSRAQVEAEREAARARKARQRSKGSTTSDRSPTGQYVTPGSRRDSERDSTREERPESPGESPATRPVPSLETPLSSQSDPPPHPPGPDDDPDGSGTSGHPAPRPDPPPAPAGREARAQTACDQLGQADHDAARARGEVRNPAAHLAACQRGARTQHLDAARHAAHQHPDWDPHQLADHLHPQTREPANATQHPAIVLGQRDAARRAHDQAPPATDVHTRAATARAALTNTQHPDRDVS